MYNIRLLCFGCDFVLMLWADCSSEYPQFFLYLEATCWPSRCVCSDAKCSVHVVGLFLLNCHSTHSFNDPHIPKVNEGTSEKRVVFLFASTVQL